jgi:hypothetical protein
MNRRLFALVLLAFASSAASATGNTNDGPGGQQRQEMFAQMKQIHIQGIQGRISILQTTLSCVNAASSHDQMKACREQEHQAMESLEQQQKSKMQALRPAGGNDGPRGEHAGGRQ